MDTKKKLEVNSRYGKGAPLNELAPLAERIAKGRVKYPNGCTLLSLLDERGEVAHAVNKYESEERVRDELLDVAAVAMRLYLGEIDRGLEIDGLAQRRRLHRSATYGKIKANSRYGKTPSFNHTRADGPHAPCPCDECLPLMSKEQLLAYVRGLRSERGGEE